MRIECCPLRSSRSDSSLLPGGTRKSSRFAARLRIWSLESDCFAMAEKRRFLPSIQSSFVCLQRKFTITGVDCIVSRYKDKRFLSLLRGKCVMGKDRNLLLASQFARSPRCLNECGKMVGGWWKAEGRRNYHHEEHEEHEGGKESRCFRPFMLFLLHGKKSFSALARKMALHHEEKGGHEGKNHSEFLTARLTGSPAPRGFSRSPGCGIARRAHRWRPGPHPCSRTGPPQCRTSI